MPSKFIIHWLTINSYGSDDMVTVGSLSRSLRKGVARRIRLTRLSCAHQTQVKECSTVLNTPAVQLIDFFESVGAELKHKFSTHKQPGQR